MVEDPTRQPSEGQGQRAGPEETRIWIAMFLALAVGLIGVIDGLMMALKKHVAPCPNGHYFPEGTTDFRCFVHPRLGVGIAIVVFSLLLGALVVFSGITAAAMLRARSTTGARVD
jgi:hypothetical protein